VNDGDVLRDLLLAKLERASQEYQTVLLEARRTVFEPLADLSSFELMHLASVQRRRRKWQTWRQQFNELLAAAGNPQRLPNLACTFDTGDKEISEVQDAISKRKR
jgi:hypothetical protein